MGTITRKRPLFNDREEAAELLAEKLEGYRHLRPLILTIPRGGVPLGRILSDHLGGELDVILVHKLRAPGNPDFAIGAVSEGGSLYSFPYPQHLWVPKDFLQEEIRKQVRALEQRRDFYRPRLPKISAANRVVLIVDDGISTGSTMLAAIREVDRQRPAKIVVAAPMAPPECIEPLRHEADELVLLTTRSDFRRIGDFFEDFEKVTDTDVVRLLKGGTSLDGSCPYQRPKEP